MSNIEPEQLAELREIVAIYQPNHGISQGIGEISLLTVSGPTAIGKSSTMKLTDIHIVPGFTTRPRRKGEFDGVDYRFRPDEPKTYADIIGKAASGNYVQVEVGPGNFAYGSELQDFRSASIMDNTAVGVQRMRSLPFRRLRSAYLVAPFHEWVVRFRRRLPDMSSDALRIRMHEAVESLGTALDDEQFYFVDNSAGRHTLAAAELSRLLHRDPVSSDARSRQVGLRLLNGINDLIAEDL